ncbi:hypothetical protein [Foetidibacter luteolus]|uniref:hypothetical protein n=1 Tax=Foetidibacter luteolus TaxID=2608880 RepID=UPI00129A17D6|nr:hypothetical protein [Foetidibacter luteolus]
MNDKDVRLLMWFIFFDKGVRAENIFGQQFNFIGLKWSVVPGLDKMFFQDTNCGFSWHRLLRRKHFIVQLLWRLLSEGFYYIYYPAITIQMWVVLKITAILNL